MSWCDDAHMRQHPDLSGRATDAMPSLSTVHVTGGDMTCCNPAEHLRAHVSFATGSIVRTLAIAGRLKPLKRTRLSLPKAITRRHTSGTVCFWHIGTGSG